ncbi:MAG: DUF4446 family protein [Mycobacteriales bacterium]
MLSIDSTTLDVLAIAGTALGAIGVLTASVTASRLAALRHQLAVLERPDGSQETVLGAVERQANDVNALRRELGGTREELGLARGEIAEAIRHVAVVRYDAFADMGGRMSFSAALLDDGGDGLVITAINGRTETRSYAKGVKAGRSDNELSPEEQQVIGLAMRGEQAAEDSRRGAR